MVERELDQARSWAARDDDENLTFPEKRKSSREDRGWRGREGHDFLHSSLFMACCVVVDRIGTGRKKQSSNRSIGEGSRLKKALARARLRLIVTDPDCAVVTSVKGYDMEVNFGLPCSFYSNRITFISACFLRKRVARFAGSNPARTSF